MNATKRLLLVDDEEGVLKALALLIGLLKFEIVTATSGAAALAIFDSSSIDMVVSDLRMPNMNGMELFREIRRRNSATKFVLISAHADISEQSQALSQGVDAFVAKPFSLDQIKAVLCP